MMLIRQGSSECSYRPQSACSLASEIDLKISWKCQNSNSGNPHQNEWNIKITAQTLHEGINNTANKKGGKLEEDGKGLQL